MPVRYKPPRRSRAGTTRAAALGEATAASQVPSQIPPAAVRRAPEPGTPESRAPESPAQSFDLGFLDDLLGYNLRRAQLAAFANFARTMAAFDISPGQLGALALIQANAGLMQTALGEALGIKRASVVPLLDRLEQRELIVRAKRPKDRRSHALFLTPTGQRLLREIKPRLQEHEGRIAAGLTDDERRSLCAMLRRIRA